MQDSKLVLKVEEDKLKVTTSRYRQ